MLGDLIEVVKTLSEFDDKFKQVRFEQRDRVSNYCTKVADCLLDIATQIKSGEVPISKCAELEVYVEDLPKIVGNELGRNKAAELTRILRKNLSIKAISVVTSESISEGKHKEDIQLIESLSGTFRGLSVLASTSEGNTSSVKLLRFRKAALSICALGFLGGVIWIFNRNVLPSLDPLQRVSLESEMGIDYKLLQKSLTDRDWRMANAQTRVSLLKIASKVRSQRRADQNWLHPEDINGISCPDLRTINQLWAEASRKRFGIVAQSKIWKLSGGTTSTQPDSPDVRRKFSTTVGWEGADKGQFNLEKLYQKMNGSGFENMPEGYLPSAIGQYQDDQIWVGEQNEFTVLTAKLEQCGILQ